MALSETLRRLHERQQHEEEITRNAPKYREEWKAAVRGLLASICEYLAEYEKQNFLSFIETTISLTEDILGTYEIGSLNITVPDARALILVQPVAFMVTGAFGRVDIHRQGRSSDWDRVMLLRRKVQGQLRWQISIPHPNTALGNMITTTTALFTSQQPARQFEPFTKESLERAIDALLK